MIGMIIGLLRELRSERFSPRAGEKVAPLGAEPWVVAGELAVEQEEELENKAKQEK